MTIKSKNIKTKKLTIKALSIAEPWGYCIINKGKNIENRSWNTIKRGYVAIHTSKKFDKDRFEYCNKKYNLKVSIEDCDFGAIIGFAEIVEVITKKEVTLKTKKWFMGDYGFVLDNIIKLKEPISATGALGFWKLSPIQIKKIKAQLTASQFKKLSENILT